MNARPASTKPWHKENHRMFKTPTPDLKTEPKIAPAPLDQSKLNPVRKPENIKESGLKCTIL